MPYNDAQQIVVVEWALHYSNTTIIYNLF